MRACEVCDGPGPVLYAGGARLVPDARHNPESLHRYACVKCHPEPVDEFFGDGRWWEVRAPLRFGSKHHGFYATEAEALSEARCLDEGHGLQVVDRTVYVRAEDDA